MERSDYYKTRLEHTIQYTQQATRLIYILNGALIVMLYFIYEKMNRSDYQWQLEIMLILGLFLINATHGYILLRQAKWYRALDDAFAESVNTRPVRLGWGLGVQALYADLHFLVSAVLLIGGIMLWVSGQPL